MIAAERRWRPRLAFAALLLGLLGLIAPDAQALDQVLSLRDGVLSRANFGIAWIGPRRCLATIRPVDGNAWNDPNGSPEIRVQLDCRRRLNGAVADFTLFGGVALGSGWTVQAAHIADGGSDGGARVEARQTPPAGSTTPLIRVRLDAGRKQLAAAKVKLVVEHQPPSGPLPACLSALEFSTPDLVCSADVDCGSPNHVCSVACGNRCIRR